MKIVKTLDELYNVKINSLSIGNFDGIHLGHASIIKKLVKLPGSLLITFTPSPGEILFPKNNIAERYITTNNEKIDILKTLELENLLIMNFDKKLANTNAQNFIAKIVEKIHHKIIIIGYNNRFGKNGKGDYELLTYVGNRHGFKVIRVPPIYFEGFPVSSSWIRNEIKTGNIEKTATLLGRLYSMSGKVIQGEKLGKTLGYPTANIEPSNKKIVPKNGVYAVIVKYKNMKLKGMTSIGASQTFKKKFSIETHIFDFKENILEKEIHLQFVKYLRENQNFNSIDKLRMQLQKDEKLTKKRLQFITNPLSITA